MITEFNKYYQYTIDEIKSKLNWNLTIASNIKDKNLLYLIKLYIIYKEGYANTDPNEIVLTVFDKKDKNFLIFYVISKENISTWLTVENENEFIDFINDPDMFILTKKYNL